MSLWYKSLDQVTFADVEAFCLQKIPEGDRLDYKAGFPNNLGKLIAAYANCWGGLILLGVDADRRTNEPSWPPCGLDGTGIEERITSICRDQIFPPVRPLIRVIENPDPPGTVVAIVRVDESPEAPHSIKGKVYARTRSQGEPIDVADIDRIKYLLDRRAGVERKWK